MQASPLHRAARTSAASRPMQARLALALLALLAQIILPHVHRLQVAARHDAPGVTNVADATPTLAAAHDATEHAESQCPVCQALAASHDFLAATAHHPVPAASSIVRRGLHDARTGHTPARAHAPRSPPLAA
ncbi:MAG: hypothetical protein U0842_00940 [Candidatus Binatia bacterium]